MQQVRTISDTIIVVCIIQESMPHSRLLEDRSSQDVFSYLARTCNVPEWTISSKHNGLTKNYASIATCALERSGPIPLDSVRCNPFAVLSSFIRVAAGLWLLYLIEKWQKPAHDENFVLHEADTMRFTKLEHNDFVFFMYQYRLVYRMKRTIDSLVATSPDSGLPTVHKDFDEVANKAEYIYRAYQDALNYGTSMASLMITRLNMKQNRNMQRLNILALVYIPLSFVATIFGMNVDVLANNKARWWETLIGIAIMYTLTGIALLLVNFVNWGKVAGHLRRRLRLG